MQAEIKNLDRVNSLIRSSVEEYCKRVLAAAGKKVKSICLYGSAAGKDFLRKRSNINLAIVLERVDQETLRSLHETVRWGQKRGIVAPLLLTQSYIATSVDVFPIEISEIKSTAIVLYGFDPLEGIAIERDDLRLECEFQAKSGLLRTWQAYLEHGSKSKGVERILHTSLTSLIPMLRAILRLKGIEPPERKADAISEFGRQFGLDVGVLLEIHRDRTGDEKIGGESCHAVMGRYLDVLQSIVEKVDSL